MNGKASNKDPGKDREGVEETSKLLELETHPPGLFTPTLLEVAGSHSTSTSTLHTSAP